MICKIRLWRCGFTQQATTPFRILSMSSIEGYGVSKMNSLAFSEILLIVFKNIVVVISWSVETVDEPSKCGVSL